MDLPASTRPRSTLAEHEPTLVQYRFFWPTNSSSSERHRIIPSSSGSSSSQDQSIERGSQLFTGSRGVRKNVDEVELFDDDWIDVGSKRQLPSKVVRSKSSANSSNVGRTLQLVKKKQKQVTLEGFMR